MNTKTMMVALLVFLTLTGLSCDFILEAEATSVTVGEAFFIRATVEKTHNRCVYEAAEGFSFDASENITLIGRTEWEEVTGDVFQTWLKVEPKKTGTGYVKIWKNCSKDGYDEEVMAFEVLSR